MKGSIVASIATAFGASLCCTGPILLSLFGATTIGAFSFIEPIRPYITFLALGILGFAFLKVYKKDLNNECCEIDKEKVMKKNKIQKRTLLGITPIILALVLFPYYNGVLFGGEPQENDSKGVVSEWTIEGMTCQGCARGLQGGMAAVKGVVSCEVNYKTNSMVCTYNDKVLNSEKVAEHVAKMGYKAIPKQKETEESTSTS